MIDKGQRNTLDAQAVSADETAADRPDSGADAESGAGNSAVKKTARQGAFYIFAGASAALLELGLFQLLYAVFGVNVSVSNVIAVLIATAYNFVVNRNLTFSSTSNPARAAVKYCVLFAVNLCITTAAITWMVGIGVHSALAKIIMQCCVVVWNFFIYRNWVFK